MQIGVKTKTKRQKRGKVGAVMRTEMFPLTTADPMTC